jgi:hypothetical protein
MPLVIKIENVSKQYRLGLIGTNTLKGDLQRWYYNLRGLPDPTLMIGQENNLNNKVKAKVKGLTDSASTSTSILRLRLRLGLRLRVSQTQPLPQPQSQPLENSRLIGS